jgi:hypothetical protein
MFNAKELGGESSHLLKPGGEMSKEIKATTYFPHAILECMFPGILIPEDLNVPNEAIKCPRCWKKQAAVMDCERKRVDTGARTVRACFIVCKCLCGHRFHIRGNFEFTRQNGTKFEVSPLIDGSVRSAWECRDV